MKKLIAAAALAAAFTLATGTVAHAAETKMLATVAQIQLASDGASAVVTMKDAKSGQSVDVAVQDKITLDKFKDKRISVGDEIKLKFDDQGGKHVSTYFKKAGGC